MEICRRSWFVSVCLIIGFSCFSVRAQIMCPARVDRCETLTGDVFEGLLTSFLESSVGEQDANVTISMANFLLVCETVGTLRGQASQASVLTTFDCTTNFPGSCPAESETGLQYDLRCSSPDWALDGQTFIPEPGLDFNSGTDYCGLCSGMSSSTPSHCSSRCTDNCTEGLMQCTSINAGTCCNFYFDDDGDRSNDVCCSVCPSGLVSDTTFNCGCPPLDLDNGEVTYTNPREDETAHYLFTEASFACDNGYRLQNGSSRTCQTGGWDGTDGATCEFVVIDCGALQDPVNGEVDTSGGTGLNDEATYTCDPTYYVNGPPSRTCQGDSTWTQMEPTCDVCAEKIPNCVNCTAGPPDDPICTACKEDFLLDTDTNECKENAPESGKSSCGPGCIAGIIVALLALLIAGLVALAIFGAYKYLNNPATKLAKTDTEGLNGVARDNPLYLEPAAVVEEAPEAAAPLAAPEAA